MTSVPTSIRDSGAFGIADDECCDHPQSFRDRGRAQSGAPDAAACDEEPAEEHGGLQAVATGAEGMALVRAGKAIDFTGAGQDLKFDDRGELLGRPFLHQVVPDGKDVIVGIVGGGDAT